MIKFFSKKKKEVKISHGFDYVNGSYEDIVLNELKYNNSNEDFIEHLKRTNIVKVKSRDSYKKFAYKILKAKKFNLDVKIPSDVLLKNGIDAIQKIGMEYLYLKNIEKSYEIAKILFEMNDIYSAHFFFNFFVGTFYKNRNEESARKKLFHICKLDLALTIRSESFKNLSLPCITKLVQMLESEKKYDDALFIIDTYKNNKYESSYEYDLKPKEIRIRKKQNK